MTIFVKHLFDAFNRIDKTYFSSKTLKYYQNETNIENRTTYFKLIERSFTHELYYQFRKIMDYYPQLYGLLRMNGEVRKNGFDDLLDMTIKSLPDLILHEKGIKKLKRGQKLFISVKSIYNAKEELEKELSKLIVAVGEKQNFEDAIYISLNPNPKIVLNEIKEIALKANYTREEVEKLWFLSRNELINLNDYIFGI